MTERTVAHSTFVIERLINASPARVFAAYSSEAAKDQWMKAPADVTFLEKTFDFRPGGRERMWARWPNGMVSDYQVIFFDIVENQRIVLGYDMYVDEAKLSVSLSTTEFIAEGDKCRLIYTEQGAYLDGHDGAAGRKEGIGWHIENLALLMETQVANA